MGGGICVFVSRVVCGGSTGGLAGVCVMGMEVGATGQLTQGPNVSIPETKYKRANSIFFVTSFAHICGRVWPQLLHPLAKSLIGSPGTLTVTGTRVNKTKQHTQFSRFVC